MRQKQYMYYLHPLHFVYSSTNQQQQNKSKHNMSIFKEGSLNLLLIFFQYTSIQKIMKILVNKISFTKQKPPKTLDNLSRQTSAKTTSKAVHFLTQLYVIGLRQTKHFGKTKPYTEKDDLNSCQPNLSAKRIC